MKKKLVTTKLVKTRQKNKGGRPSKKTQLEHFTLIRPYWRQGFTATKCHELLIEDKKTELNLNTIQTYYQDWNEQLEESKTKDMIMEEKEIKNRAVASLELLLVDYYEIKEDVDNKVKYGKRDFVAQSKLVEKGESKTEPEMYPIYLSDRIGINKAIAELNMMKFTIEMEPTIDQRLEEQLAELIQKHRKNLKE